MKTIIAGSRSIDDFAVIDQAIKASSFEITEVVSGTAKGVDITGEAWASLNNIPIKRFPAKWDKEGRAAGMLRNARMAEHAEACIVIWDGSSVGSKNMINQATKRGLKLYVHKVENDR